MAMSVHMAIAIGVLLWLSFCVGFVVGTMWASRPVRQYPVPEFRRVAHPCIIAAVGEEYIAIAADYIAQPQDFAAADRRVLDELVETHKW
jgi:hypothetical protein